MKTFRIISLTILLLTLFLTNVSFSLDLYDDFSGPFINKDKWKQGEFVREIREFDGGDKKLASELSSPNPIVVTSYPYSNYNNLNITDPDTVTSIQADVALTEYSIVNQASVAAALAGKWYNDGSGIPWSDTTGDIGAYVGLEIRPTGIYAIWGVHRYTNASGTFIGLGSGNFITPITLETPYTLYIAYDEAANQFTFRVGAEEYTFGPVGLPAWVRNANMPGKSLQTRVRIDNSTSSGRLFAIYDNVYKNGSSYDDFPTTTIDQKKWRAYEFVREISEGKLREKIRSSTAYTSFVNNYLEVLYPLSTNVIQAKVTLLEYQNSQGLWQVADLSGTFYNDGTPGGDFIGDVVGQVLIGGSNINPIAAWRIYKYTNATGTTSVLLDSGVFSTPILLGETYTLYLGWNGTEFFFKFNNEVASYTPITSIKPANIPFKRLRTIIIPTVDKKEGMIEALFDDVYTDTPSPCEGDFDGDGDVDGSDLAIFAADFGRTNCNSPGVPPCEGDFDKDGDVDGSDLAVFAADFGRTDCPKK